MTTPNKNPTSRSSWACLFALTYTVIIITLVMAGALPFALLIAYALSSLASYVLYAFDKTAAKRKERRTPEYSLHLWALFGGWIGGAFAQHILRHKTQKAEFQWVFWLSVVANISFVGYLFLIEPYL
ncbi:DUF1294 domain-containing protein [Moraxella sp. Tifton1]|uniref:DUF1294 domain-containing protein n=1 Tax=Moraxella oculi TaxID=2940516 RepID=A0ABW8U9K4_9GAMM|nr:DUF1294 domain-containing protein [Moraxella sp. Tifton1]MCL1623557.1 DUF1294 domain-containing protein [Moraxella sp. Tifton1]